MRLPRVIARALVLWASRGFCQVGLRAEVPALVADGFGLRQVHAALVAMHHGLWLGSIFFRYWGRHVTRALAAPHMPCYCHDEEN